jgi:predicted O-methyltransferase YrrM
MRARRHWNGRYALDRLRVALHERRHRDEPWLTAEAVRLLDRLLRPTDRCFEWGSGRSTLWLARRTGSVRSVEHDREWYEKVQGWLVGHPGARVELAGPEPDLYVAPVRAAGPFDLVLVDGIHRDACALAALPELRDGGLLVIDNVERYLPSQSRSPEAIVARYESDRWRELDDACRDWRRIWTTNGVSDTALFFRP